MKEKKALVDHTLAGRTGRANDLLQAVRFLLAEADYMTGATLRLDGGYLLGGDKVPPMPQGVE